MPDKQQGQAQRGGPRIAGRATPTHLHPPRQQLLPALLLGQSLQVLQQRALQPEGQIVALPCMQFHTMGSARVHTSIGMASWYPMLQPCGQDAMFSN